MKEKTAEEKLRQLLEGDRAEINAGRKSPRRVVGRVRKPQDTKKINDEVKKSETKKISVPLTVTELKEELGIRNEELGITDNVPDLEVIEEPAVEIAQEPEIVNEPVEVPEPVVEVEQEPEEEPELPEIPLIEEESQEEFLDAGNEELNDGLEGNLPDIPVISAEESENEDASGDFIEPENLPPADIVLNVNEEIPQPQEIFDPDKPEGDSVPVSVSMPETTKTAEDKLMADIAEAMTGSPLTLEARETPDPYKLPEDFLNEVNSDPSQQSAEEKLKANIAQAMSESPFNAAADNANQNFEDELNNLGEFLPSSFPNREEPLTEELDLSAYEEDEPENTAPAPEQEDEPGKPDTEIEATFDESPLPDPVDEPDPEPAEELGVRSEELGVVDNVPETESDAKIIDNVPEESEPAEELGIRNEELGVIDEIPETESDAEIIDEPVEELEPEPEPEAVTPQENTEVSQINEMPEQSLLDEENKFTELSPESSFEDSEDDFDINSLGELSAAASMPDYEEPLEEITPSTPSTENFNDSFDDNFDDNYGFDANTPSHGGFINPNPGEEKDKEKVMGLREKVAKKVKNKNPDKNDKGKNLLGRFLMPVLMLLLLAVGGFIAWQLFQLNNRLSSSLANIGMGNFESVPVESANPSYEYAIDFIFDTNLAGRMAQRGKEGWQVVGSRRTQDTVTGQLGYEFIFMRKTPGR